MVELNININLVLRFSAFWFNEISYYSWTSKFKKIFSPEYRTAHNPVWLHRKQNPSPLLILLRRQPNFRPLPPSLLRTPSNQLARLSELPKTPTSPSFHSNRARWKQPELTNRSSKKSAAARGRVVTSIRHPASVPDSALPTIRR